MCSYITCVFRKLESDNCVECSGNCREGARCLRQTCQGPEMKMRETVRHSGKGAIFSRGEEAALPVMRPLSKFSDSCLHSCCRTEEIKFSIKPITRKPIQNLWLFYQIKYETLSIRRTYVYSNFSPQKENTCDIKNIVFFVEQENAWDFHCAEWERETHRKCASLTRDAWDLAGLLRQFSRQPIVIHNTQKLAPRFFARLANIEVLKDILKGFTF